mgnify:CR=1 FL=1
MCIRDRPGEVRLEPGAASLVALHVIDDDRDDGRPAEEKGTQHAGGAEGPQRQAQRVQRIDPVSYTHLTLPTSDLV